jgi:hypothetical protein
MTASSGLLWKEKIRWDVEEARSSPPVFFEERAEPKEFVSEPCGGEL